MKIKFNNRTDTSFAYYSFHNEYKDAVLPATKEGSGYNVRFPKVLGNCAPKTTWYYSAKVVEIVED